MSWIDVVWRGAPASRRSLSGTKEDNGEERKEKMTDVW